MRGALPLKARSIACRSRTQSLRNLRSGHCIRGPRPRPSSLVVSSTRIPEAATRPWRTRSANSSWPGCMSSSQAKLGRTSDYIFAAVTGTSGDDTFCRLKFGITCQTDAPRDTLCAKPPPLYASMTTSLAGRVLREHEVANLATPTNSSGRVPERPKAAPC